MFLFTAFNTAGFIQGPMIDSIKQEDKDYTGDPFISMCIIYVMLSFGNFLAPAFVKYLGSKVAMISSALTYLIFVANFLWPQTWLLYLASVIIGLGAAIIWNAEGYYLTLCSNEETMPRHTGIFWTLFQFSQLFGNIFVAVYFKDISENTIPSHTRMITYAVLTVVGFIGIVTMFFMGKPQSQQYDEDDRQSISEVLRSIPQTFKLLKTPRMLLLCATFAYTGIVLSFFSGVYTTAMGRIKELDPDGISAKKYIGIAGIVIGSGEIIGGFIFSIASSKFKLLFKWGRDPIVIIGFLCHMLAFFLTFINFPSDSTITDTEAVNIPYIKPSLAIALICGFLFGFGDSCFNTQVISMLGILFSNDSTSAFALFKSIQSLACACAFFYANVANLYVQLAILAISASVSAITFVLVEWRLRHGRT